VEGCCEQGIEPSGSVKCWKVLEFNFLSNSQVVVSYCHCIFNFNGNEISNYRVTVLFLIFKSTADVFQNILNAEMLILLHYFDILCTTTIRTGKLQILLLEW
jgi:hypothetical protein